MNNIYPLAPRLLLERRYSVVQNAQVVSVFIVIFKWRLKFSASIVRKALARRFFISALFVFTLNQVGYVQAATLATESIQACVVDYQLPFTPANRAHIAHCLQWDADNKKALCHGDYQPVIIPPMKDKNEIQIKADESSLYSTGRSELRGGVKVAQSQQIISAQTASVFRDPVTGQVTQIQLIGGVRYLEPDKFMIAKKVTINPSDKSGEIESVLYRFGVQQAHATLPAWGQARWVQRFANQMYLLRKATYTTCAPEDNAWQLEAREILLNQAKSEGVARSALLRLHDWPILYAPYLSFPTSKARKSGFLMPVAGYSNVGGFDYAQPYYWNMAPNYDATITPHAYSRRGLMLGTDFRFLTKQSTGVIGGKWLPNDQAFHQFIHSNAERYPHLQELSDNRWSVMLFDTTSLSDKLHMTIQYQQVSDPYYLQDFSSNLAVLSENQLLQQGTVTYATDHWLFNGMLQRYQTLHPINQSTVTDIYQRLPQLTAHGFYAELPFNANLDLFAEFDAYHWPGLFPRAEGPRYHLNPVLSFPWYASWGYLTPKVELVENYYQLTHYNGWTHQTFNRTIPRYNLDGGMVFERMLGTSYRQTLEPRLNYLYVPYYNQTAIPVFDSAYMIFNFDQLFRVNRFSGYDRIGDTNQLAYALTSRWLSDESGQEKASIGIGQMRYFSRRRVPLCQRADGVCRDNPLTLGLLSPDTTYSPFTSRAAYQINSNWSMHADYSWDGATRSTNNADFNFHFQPVPNHIINLGYTYLVNGNITEMINRGVQSGALHQATLAYAWPVTEKWSGFGAYSYNISKGYDMMTFVGVQYESCCWAMRVMGGRTFQSLNPVTASPQYNKNMYLQLLLKGLGTAASNDPSSIIQTYLPGYNDLFH